ncbi:MAG: preprotein translocase subunit SecE [Ruminococcaceae bacterium]|nr:preprotein translocase subunit SecE [Oscillospiraceae bacterium]
MKGTMKKWMAAFTTALLAISLFAIPAFAAEESEKKGLTTGQIVGIIIAAVVVIVAVVLCIKFREKLSKFFRVYKSEVKKIVWLPWNQTLKSSYVVTIMLIVCAAAICLLDVCLSNLFKAFIKLF